MGRYKIYDHRKLVSIEEDANYGKCLLCKKKLKTLMGNIKRHYEQMHSVYVNANGKKSKKYKKKRSNVKQFKKNNESNKMCTQQQALNSLEIPEKERKKSLEEPTATTSSTCTSQSNSLAQGIASNQQVQLINSSNLAPTPILNKDSNTKIQPNQLAVQHSNSKKAKLVEENDDIQIPCYSFINNIKINSAETSSYQLEFLKCLVETKAHVNIPLKPLQNVDTFQKALKNWKLNFQFNYSPQTIGDHIDRMTKKLHQEIKKFVANRLVYLKLDITHNTRGNVMLINIQFIKDFKFYLITLNALELSDDELATYLKKKVLSTLTRFKIEINNVFSITKDNTNNVGKHMEKYEKMCENSSTTEYCQNLTYGFPGHAIHFAASDIMEQFNENISQSRDSVRRLMKEILQFDTKSTPLLDNNNNWFSVYEMIESLITVCNEIESKSISLTIEVDLVFAKKFIESFRPIVDTAIKLQTDEIVLMGDFYREWLHCEMQLKELSISNELALYLLQALHIQKLEFFKNSTFLAALYLDPRFCYVDSKYLNNKQKEMAIVQLLQIFNKLKTMPETRNFEGTNSNNRYDMLEKQFLTKTETKHICQIVSINDISEQRVKEYLEQLQFDTRLPFQTHILDYWNMAKYRNPVLAKIAEIALAAPATQATLSRAMNASSITLLECKRNENAENIENLLLLKLNENLVDKISLEN